MSELPGSNARQIALRDLSPMAILVLGWLRALARALKMFRLYKSDNPAVRGQRAQLIAQALEILKNSGAIDLRITPSEIYLADEVLIRPGSGRSNEEVRAAEELLPFQIYRDGIRRVVILADTPDNEIGVLIDALYSTGVGSSQDDLVTLLWQGNLTHIQIESVAIEQTIYLSVRRGGGGGPAQQTQAYAWSPQGAEIRGAIGQAPGTQGLHRDTFDDWELPEADVDARIAWGALEGTVEAAKARLTSRWKSENEAPWTTVASQFMRQLLEVDSSDETRIALAHSVVTWLSGALQRSAWAEAQEALGLLREIDPDGTRSALALEQSLAGLDVSEIALRMDEDDAIDHARFAAVIVGIGVAALDLACTVLCVSNTVRPRAAASSALCYLCNDHPEMLAPYLADSRWTMVRNVVFVLGQIGGSDVTPLLRVAADHREVRVRRAVVQSLGGVPREERAPVLIQQLETRDSQLLSATLNMLTRERNPRVARALLDRIEAPDFESRNEDNQRALFNALAEIADDAVVPRIEALLHKGGWFARRTLMRVAAARVLRRLGTESATAALEAGLRSKSDAVRSACLDAMSMRMTP